MPLRPPAGFRSAFYDPLKVADAPTIGTATAGDAQASVTFTAPSNVGGAAITAYYGVSNPGQFTGTAASSPVTVTGLTNGTAYTFRVWALNSYGPSPYSAATGSVTPAVERGLFMGGAIGAAYSNVIDYVSIGTTGNATDFGDLIVGVFAGAGCASTTRGLTGGGEISGGRTAQIQYVTIATTGNATNFGNLSNSAYALSAFNSATRGVFSGGIGSPSTNTIDYVTISTTGNALDFGDLLTASRGFSAFSSPTRGIFGGGDPASNVIQYVTIASTGNTTDFGDFSQTYQFSNGASNSTRGLAAGGVAANSNVINYITIATLGNGANFGNLIDVGVYGCSGNVASSTRALFKGTGNVIQYVTIATTGNSIDFGDLTVSRTDLMGCSSANGGVQ